MIPIISLLCILVVLSGTPIHIIITSDCGNFIQTEYDLPSPLFIRYNGELIAYNMILLMNPNDLTAGIEKGRILYQLGRFDEAIQAFDAVIRMIRKMLMHGMKKHLFIRIWVAMKK